jgi:DNA (cytosine-5)-methyltransferase 1
MSRPRLLDLFCGAGGAAMGYHRAGFDVVGVDINPQPHYPFEFIQANILDIFNRPSARHGWSWVRSFNAIHASPPCQHYANVTKWTGVPDDHSALLAPTRAALRAYDRPYVIENVRTSALRSPVVLCGSQFGLPIRRHRYFESNVALPWFLPPCQHRSTDLAFEHKGERAYAVAMGVPWMTNVESRQAIPPAFSEWIGTQLLAAMEAAA